MDGEVIKAGIEDDFLQKYPIEYIDSYEELGGEDTDEGKREFSEEEARNLKEQLKDLGYM